VLGFALLSAPAAVCAADDASARSFIKISGTAFTLDGGPFPVTGVNNHYLTYGSRNEVTRVLDDAVAMGANVVRTFLQPAIGSLDGSIPTIWNWRNKADASDLGVLGGNAEGRLESIVAHDDAPALLNRTSENCSAGAGSRRRALSFHHMQPSPKDLCVPKTLFELMP
jgi:hypothetical protein